MSAPTGKGMFIRNWSVTGTPAAAVAKAKSAGLSWVSPMFGWWGEGTQAQRNTGGQKYVDAFKSAGIEVWPWLYPTPKSDASGATAIAIQRIVAAGVSGLILDPEAEYRKKPNAALALMKLARASADGLPIGVSSYGYAPYHPTFPYAEFSSADFGVPQVYDLKDNQKSTYQRKGADSWRAKGFGVVIPALTTASATAVEVVQEYAQSDAQEAGAVVWWDWQTTQPSEWDAIAAVNLPGKGHGGTGLIGTTSLMLIAAAGVALYILKGRG